MSAAQPATPAPTKERLVASAGEMFRRQGFCATGVKQLADAAGAQLGSLYHFFPRGKEELAASALREGGRHFEALWDSFFDDETDVAGGAREFFAGAARTLEATGYSDACPIATVASEVAGTNEPLREVCAEIFEAWIAAATGRFRAAGVPPGRARELAVSMLCAMEGAFLLCRTLRSTRPMHVAGEAFEQELRAAVSDAA